MSTQNIQSNKEVCLDGGSMGSIITSWKKLVIVVKNSIVYLLSWNVKNIVVRLVSINTELYRFGIRVLREYTFLLKQNLKKESTTLPKLNLKRVMVGKVIRLGIGGYIHGLRKFSANLENVRLAVQRKRRSMIGQIKAVIISVKYQTGNVCA